MRTCSSLSAHHVTATTTTHARTSTLVNRRPLRTVLSTRTQAEDKLNSERARLETQNADLSARLTDAQNEAASLRQQLVRAKTDFDRERQRLTHTAASDRDLQACSNKDKVNTVLSAKLQQPLIQRCVCHGRGTRSCDTVVGHDHVTRSWDTIIYM